MTVYSDTVFLDIFDIFVGKDIAEIIYNGIGIADQVGQIELLVFVHKTMWSVYFTPFLLFAMIEAVFVLAVT